MIPTTLSPGLRQLPDPCWTVVMADGSLFSTGGEWTPGCWASKEKAEAGLLTFVSDERPAVFMEVTREDYRCWELVLVCGDQFVHEGEVDQVHFEDRADLLEAMVAANVVQVDGVGQYAIADCCAECAAAIGTPAPDRPVQVHPDQAPLIAGPGDTIPEGWV